MWQRVMGENIWRFNQVLGAGVPLKEGGKPVYTQPPRDEITSTLNQAWELLSTYLGYFPRPVYVGERIPINNASPYQLQKLRTQWGYVQAYGQRATTVIQADAAVAYSDSDGDGILDLATVTVTTTVDAAEIQAFFRVADGAESAANEQWQIEPARVTKSGNTATIRFHRALGVQPSIWKLPYLYDNNNYETINTANTSNPNDFITACDVYRVYTDTSQAFVIQDNAYSCSNCGLGNATSTSTAAAIRSVDSQLGIFQVRLCDCNMINWQYPPESVDVYYLAGYPLVNGFIDHRFEMALTRLANSKVSQTLCNLWDQRLDRFTTDRDPMPRDLLQPSDVGNPLGITRGEIEAWRIVKYSALGQGGKL
jgi:hypothetical protein